MSASYELLSTLRSNVPSGVRIVFVSGTFNILHPGHLRLLRFAAECGEFLVVGVFTNNLSGKAYLDQSDRLEAVRSVGWVNHVLLLDIPPEQAIAYLKPDIVVKGSEHAKLFNPEQSVAESYGGKLVFGSGDTTFSSISLLREEARQVNFSSIHNPSSYQKRHSCFPEEILPLLERMRECRVAVIGDTIVDEYITCDPLGMSQEDPTIVVTPILSETFIGGAAIVAAHAKGLGASKVAFFSVTGIDSARQYVIEILAQHQITSILAEDSSRPTTLKQRFRAGQKTLLRVNRLRQHKISPEIQDSLWQSMEALIPDYDLLIFSDFNYGTLPQQLVDRACALAKKNNIMMVADSQCSSQIGDVSRFRGMSLLTPTEREARIALSNFEDGLVVLAELLKRKADAKNIIITLGFEGILIHSASNNPWITDRIPALNLAPKDVAGAGDSLLVSAAMALKMGASIWQAAYIGSLAAACQVGRLGNLPLSGDTLIQELTNSHCHDVY